MWGIVDMVLWYVDAAVTFLVIRPALTLIGMYPRQLVGGIWICSVAVLLYGISKCMGRRSVAALMVGVALGWDGGLVWWTVKRFVYWLTTMPVVTEIQ